MNFKVLNSKIGFAAEVFGIDATQKLSQEHKIELTRLINEYTVIIFKNQKINDDEQIKFSENFGKIEPAGTNTELTKLKDRRLSFNFVSSVFVPAGSIFPKFSENFICSSSLIFWFLNIITVYSLINLVNSILCS